MKSYHQRVEVESKVLFGRIKIVGHVCLLKKVKNEKIQGYNKESKRLVEHITWHIYLFGSSSFILILVTWKLREKESEMLATCGDL